MSWLGDLFGGGSTPPPTPNYTALNEQQGRINQQLESNRTIANRMNQVNPFGSTNYEVPYLRDENGEFVLDDNGNRQVDPAGQWTQTQTLNEGQQAILDQQTRGQRDAYWGSRLLALDRYSNAEGARGDLLSGAANIKGLNFRSLNDRYNPNTENLPELVQFDNSNLPQMRGVNLSSMGPMTNINPATLQANQLADRGVLSDLRRVNEGIAPQRMVNAGETGQQALLRRLEPQIQRRRSDLENRLANQGIVQGSEAYNREMELLGQQENDLVSQAAVQGIGLGEQVRSGFFGEQVNMANLSNAQRQQLLQEQLGLTGQANQLRQQQANEQATISQLNLANRGQQFNEEMGAANVSTQQRNQMYQEEKTAAELSNRQRDLMYRQEMGLATLSDQRRLSDLNEQIQMNQAEMAQRSYQINENQRMRDLSTNERLQAINILQGGLPTLGNPSQQQGYMQGQVAPPDLVGGAQQTYNAQMNQYNANQQGNNNLLNAIGTGVGLWASSDRRLKKNIKKVGELKGLNVYDFDYIWNEPSTGFMADEVEELYPDMVVTHENGYKMVNYGGILNA